MSKFLEKQEISVFPEVSTPAMRPTQTTIQCILGGFPGPKWWGYGTGHSPPSSVSVVDGQLSRQLKGQLLHHTTLGAGRV
jgi:hypothetical protein